jgi:GDP/UDP-N,N'-diacetylbacillosamine 2-epimerase (hydrolysing)
LKNICVVTGTRAEYGLLRWVMDGIKKSKILNLQVIATGMHLSPEFGLTYREIEKDGFKIDRKIEMLLSADSPSSISKSTGMGLIGFADAYNALDPDMVVVLGDRFEVFAASFPALVACIPIVHIHGGEITQGAYDESIRHAVTKMAYLHFTATESYQKRVVQLGEAPERVYNVGGMGVDAISKTNLLKKKKLERELGFRFGARNLMVTFHPVTLENRKSETQFNELLTVLESLDDTRIIFTSPNADTDGRVIKNMIDDFCENHSDKAVAFISMGRVNYLSSLQFVDAVVGNSSSGLAEVPSFNIGTINIGDRQKGRLRANSVIDCECNQESIRNAIIKLYSRTFQERLKSVKNPYGEGRASERILKILRNIDLPEKPKKVFYDL